MMTSKGRRKNGVSDLETLKAWCHWKKLEKDVHEDDLLMVKAIEDVIAQASQAKALHQQKNELTDKYRADIEAAAAREARLIRQIDELTGQLAEKATQDRQWPKCPDCGKDCYVAEKDGSKACVDPTCINAHGIRQAQQGEQDD